MSEIENLIAAIQPYYAENKAEVAKILREKDIKTASKIVKPKSVWEHALIYDSSAETLEPIYFWLLDFMGEIGFKDIEKLIDNFAASPGSGYFAELGTRATKMQEEGMKMLGSINVVIKSVINLLYDLKEFEIRLRQYDLLSSKKPGEKEAGLLGLKQVWMDKVDLQRGRGSINAMAAELSFTTLRDAFMAARSIEQIDRMDLNERVKRVLKPRLAEFFDWKKSSEKELRKRFAIEKSYLKSQVGSLKLYTRWAKPYLKAAEELMMKEHGREPALVKAFNTILLELCLFSKKEIKVPDAVDGKELPKSFKKIKFKRKYYACILIDFKFRGIPSRTPQGGYLFGGRAEINFKSFALNEDELKVFGKELEKADVADAMKIVETITGESLKQIDEDIEHFLNEKEEENKKETEKKKEKPAKEKKLQLGKESYEESVLRKLAEQKAIEACFKIYDVYKKTHGMASFEEPEWNYPSKWKLSS